MAKRAIKGVIKTITRLKVIKILRLANITGLNGALK